MSNLDLTCKEAEDKTLNNCFADGEFKFLSSLSRWLFFDLASLQVFFNLSTS